MGLFFMGGRTSVPPAFSHQPIIYPVYLPLGTTKGSRFVWVTSLTAGYIVWEGYRPLAHLLAYQQ